MLSNPLKGIKYFFMGFNLIFKPGIRQWVIIPLFINICLFTALIYFAWLQTFFWVNDGLLKWLLLPVFIMITFFIFVFIGIGNLIAGPFNALLASAVKKHLTGKTSNHAWYKFHFWDSIRKFFYYLRWAIGLLILSLIPIINIASPLLWFLFAAWLVSIEYVTPSMKNHYNSKTVRQILAKKRLLVLGFGSTVLLMMMIPVVNFLVMPIAVAGGTCMGVHEF